MTKLTISFAGGSGLAGFPEFPLDLAREIQDEFPAVTVKLVQDPSSEQRTSELTDTNILYAVRFNKKDFAVCKQLKWLHLTSAGATHVLFPEMVASPVLVTNSRGLYGIPIAEHVLGIMLMFARRFHEAYPFQREGKWARPEMLSRFSMIRELHSRTAGIIGLGSIGLAVAERCKAFGMRVIANKRRGGVRPDCVDDLFGPNELHRLMTESDYVIVCTPLTKETRGMIAEAEIQKMRREAVIINVGRGAIIDEQSLIQALKTNRIAGAGLDVTDPEPPEPNSPLFDMPNVILTPHYSGIRSNYWFHSSTLFRGLLRQYLNGERMDNLVDKNGGY